MDHETEVPLIPFREGMDPHDFHPYEEFENQYFPLVLAATILASPPTDPEPEGHGDDS
jgi:hypothetical protein